MVRKIIDYDSLVDYYNSRVRDNAIFPVTVENFDKFNEYVITIKGLEQLYILKRQVLMGSATIDEITLTERLLDLYAQTNPSKKRIREWKYFIDGNMRVLMKSHYIPDLVKEGLAEVNQKYNPKYFEYWDIWTRTIKKKIDELLREENNSYVQ